jgi:uracil-DNA glycosylase
MLKLKIVPKKEEITNDWSIEKVATTYIPYTWEKVFENSKYEIKDVSDILEEDKKKGRIVPDRVNTFRVFHLVPLNNVKVVIMAQDPYFNLLPNGKPQAVGMSFSVPKEAQIPPSLRNIFKELKSTISDFKIPSHGSLEKWCLQGVFLLNACLTVRVGEPNCHGEIWSGFIKKVINAILDANTGVIFVLWGKESQKLEKIIRSRATILKGAHPSPLSAYRGFFGCNHFSQINDFLISKGKDPIDWNLI